MLSCASLAPQREKIDVSGAAVLAAVPDVVTSVAAAGQLALSNQSLRDHVAPSDLSLDFFAGDAGAVWLAKFDAEANNGSAGSSPQYLQRFHVPFDIASEHGPAAKTICYKVLFTDTVRQDRAWANMAVSEVPHPSGYSPAGMPSVRCWDL